MASVVSISAAIDDAFCSAERVTLVGSMTPAFTMSSYCSVAALKPKFGLALLRTFSMTMAPSTPALPLTGIVCLNRGEFDRLAADHVGGSPGVQGYYDPRSNRLTLYDMGGNGDSANWHRNAAVLIHEATHQMAFNTGIHSRYVPPPAWLAEGLATLFEAPGVCDSHNHTQMADRVNRDRLRAFQRFVAPRHRPEVLASVVASDDLFHVNPQAAYAEAWALTFCLIETEPRKYSQYLKRTASRPPFRKYTAAERTADFTAVFGGDWRMLEARFLRFMAGVK